MFVDDEYIFWSAEHVYSLFKSDPQAGLVVAADPTHSVLFERDWCYNTSSLEACFSWLGFGSLVSRATVQAFLQRVALDGWPSDEVALADNFYATLAEPLHGASLVLQTEEVSLDSKQGFSDGVGGQFPFRCLAHVGGCR